MLFLAPATATWARLISRRHYDRGRRLDYCSCGYRLLHDHRLRLHDLDGLLHDNRLLLHDHRLRLHDLDGLLHLDHLGECRTSGNETCTYDHFVHVLYSIYGRMAVFYMKTCTDANANVRGAFGHGRREGYLIN